MAENIRKENQKIPKPGNQYTALIPRFAFTAFLTVTLLAVSMIPVSASTIFEVAKNAMQTVYKDVAGIATVAAVVLRGSLPAVDEFFKIRPHGG